MELFKLLGTIAINNTEANRALDDTTSKAKSFGDKMSSVFGNIGDAALKVAKVSAAAVGTVATGLAAMTKSAISYYAEYEQNLGGSEAVFAEHAEKIQGIARDAFSNMGLSTSDYLATINKMGALFQGAGFTVEESMNMATEAMQRSADVASIMGIDTSAAMEAIAGAAKGNFEMMDNLGIAMNDTTLQAYALEKGLEKTTKEMTNQEKIGLAMEMFLEKTGYAMGNFARESAETISGSFGMLKAAWQNFLAGMADSEQDFNKLLNNLIDSAITAADNIVPRIVETLPRLVEGLTQLFNRLFPYIPPLLEALIPAAIQGLLGIARAALEALPGILEQLFPGIGGRLGVAIQNFMSTIAKFCASAAPQIVSAFETVLNIIVSVLEWINGLDDSTKQFILTAAAVAVGLSPVLAMIGKIISVGSGLIGGIAKVVSSAGSLIGSFGQVASVGATLAGGISKIVGLVGSLLGGIGNLVVAVGSKLVAALASIGPVGWAVIAVISALIAIGVALYKNWDEICAWASKIWSAIKETISNAIDSVIGFFENLAESAKQMKDNITEKFNEMKENVASKMEEIKEKVSSKFNELKEKVVQKLSELKENAAAKIEELKENAVAKFSELRDKVEAKVNELREKAVNKFEELKEKALSKVEELKEKATSKVEELKEKAVSKFEELKGKATEKLAAMQQKGAEIVEGLKTKALEGFENLKSGALERFDNLKSGITDKLESVKSFVGDAVQRLKDFFNFDWDLPKIKLPHFSIDGSFSLNPPSIPSFGVEWYKDGGIMNDPTIFGFNPMTNKAMVGGEAGAEAIAPIDTLQSYVREAVGESNSQLYSVLNAILSVLSQYLPEMANMQLVMDTGEAVGALAPAMDEELGRIAYMRGRTNG